MVLSKDMKIAICFGLIMGAIISICNMCFAAENVELSLLSNISFDSANNELRSTPGFNTYYIDIEPGYSYTIKTTTSRYIAFFNDTTIGSSVFDGFTLVSGGTYTFNGGSSKYLYVGQSGSSASIEVTREPLQGINSFVDNLAYALSIGNLSQVWVYVVPFLTISVLFGLGFYLGCKIFDKIKRAKGGV